MNPNVSPKSITVLADGGCHNNNKPVTERDMYGSFTVFNKGVQVASTVDSHKQVIHTIHFGCDEWASNNLAELLILEKALWYLHDLIDRSHQESKKVGSVTVMSDSEWALGMATGVFKLKNSSDKALAEAIGHIKLLVREISEMGVMLSFIHVDNRWVKSVLGH